MLGLLCRAGLHVYSTEMIGNLLKGEAYHDRLLQAGPWCAEVTNRGRGPMIVCKRVGTPWAARWYLRGVESPCH